MEDVPTGCQLPSKNAAALGHPHCGNRGQSIHSEDGVGVWSLQWPGPSLQVTLQSHPLSGVSSAPLAPGSVSLD